MEQNKIIKLFTGEKVQTKEREFTRLIGGFGDNKPMFLVWQCSDLLGQATREIIQNYERNKDNFENEVDFVDLKSLITENDKTGEVDITSFLKSIGITHNKYGRTSKWLAFSFSGMMKLIKISTTKESWNIYNEFLEDYFKTKAENMVMEKTLEETKEVILEQMKYILGSIIMESDTLKKVELMEQYKKLEEQNRQIEMTLAKEQLMEQVQDRLAIADAFSQSDKEYSIDTLSRFINIKGLGRNNFYKWMRDNNILMNNNQPYQKFMDNFHVIPITNNKFAESKTLIKAKGVSYIVKKLIKDGKIQSKSYEDIIKNIDENLNVAN